MRFYDQEHPEDNTSCIKNDTEWAEAIFTTYQCLHDDEQPPNRTWFQLTCTEDGSQLIENAYNSPTGCTNLNYSGMYDGGCQYKDKYIEVLHCDYWNPNATNMPSFSPTMTREPTISPSVSGSGKGNSDNQREQDIIVWVIVLCILCFIGLLIIQLVVRKRRRQNKEIKKVIDVIVTDDDNMIVNKENESSVSDMGYDKIESEERNDTDTGIVSSTVDDGGENNNTRKFVSPQDIAANTPQTALLNNTAIN